MRSLSPLLLLAFMGQTDGILEFTHSTMYSIYDFEGLDEIPLRSCDDGCLIYAATSGYFQPSDDGFDPFIKNLVIYDSETDTNHSIAEMAVQFEPETSQKTALNLTAPGNYSILNLSGPTGKGTDVSLWVIERSAALDFDYEIYDAVNNVNQRAAGVPKDVITIMSAQPFRVMAQPGEDNSYTAYLSGFENAFDDNPDKCAYAYKTAADSKFDGFELHVDGPLLSLVFANKKKVDLSADFKYSVAGMRDISKPGFVQTSGYTACDNLGDQIHQSTFYHTSDTIEFHGEPDFYDVYFDMYILNLDDEHVINITDVTNDQVTSFSGSDQSVPFSFYKTQYLELHYFRLAAPQCFLIRHAPIAIEKATSPTVPTVPTVPTKPTVPTVPTVPTTTKINPSTTLITSTTPYVTTSVTSGVHALAAVSSVIALLLAR